MAQYNLLKDQSLSSLSAIKYKLILSRGGMQELKANGLFHFGINWKQDIQEFIKLPECLRGKRDELAKKLIQNVVFRDRFP